MTGPIAKPLMDGTVPAWHAEAACADVPAAVFFPRRGDDVEEAKAICRRCPVCASCLAYSLDNREVHGVWGGLSGRERRRIRRERKNER